MTSPPSSLDGRMSQIWEDLAQPTPPDPERASRRPEIVDAWLTRVAPSRLTSFSGVCLTMHGEIRIGKWRSFQAEQILSPRGFIWAARAGRGLVTVRGHDMFFEGTGEMNWRMFGVVPVIRQSGDDVARSASGRFAGELLVFSPFNARSSTITWFETNATNAIATVTTGGFTHGVTLRFDTEGTVLDISMPRWGDPDGDGFREETFSVVFDGEQPFGGCLLPASFIAGWGPVNDVWTDQAFFRCVIDDAGFF